jgi:transposase
MRAEVLTGPERRRRWSAEEKAGIVAEAMLPGAKVSEIARRHGISRGLLYTWRREAEQQTTASTLPELVPVVMANAGGEPQPSARERRSAASKPGGTIEIALPGGICENAPNVDPAQSHNERFDLAEFFPIPRGITIGAGGDPS